MIMKDSGKKCWSGTEYFFMFRSNGGDSERFCEAVSEARLRSQSRPPSLLDVMVQLGYVENAECDGILARTKVYIEDRLPLTQTYFWMVENNEGREASEFRKFLESVLDVKVLFFEDCPDGSGFTTNDLENEVYISKYVLNDYWETSHYASLEDLRETVFHRFGIEADTLEDMNRELAKVEHDELECGYRAFEVRYIDD